MTVPRMKPRLRQTVYTYALSNIDRARGLLLHANTHKHVACTFPSIKSNLNGAFPRGLVL